MNTNTLLILGVAGVAGYFLFVHNGGVMAGGIGASNSSTVNPQNLMAYGARPSPSAPGAQSWGMVPMPKSDAEQAADVINAIGNFGKGVGAAAEGIGSALNG